MKISFVIPAHNEEDYLPSCLTSLRAEIERNGAGYEIEVIVVDNASDDRTADIARGYGVRVVHEEIKGSSRARQTGLREATGDIVAFLDADTRVLPEWLPTFVSYFARKKTVAVSGPYRFYDFPKEWRGFAWPTTVVGGKIAHALTGCMVWGGNMAIRRDALLAVGGFNPRIKFYGEDIDIARRLSKVGRVVFTEKMVIEASARRFQSLGVLTTAGIYTANFFSVALLKKPLSREFQDFR